MQQIVKYMVDGQPDNDESIASDRDYLNQKVVTLGVPGNRRQHDAIELLS